MARHPELHEPSFRVPEPEPAPLPGRDSVLTPVLVLLVGFFLAGCASSRPPADRTALFLRSDLQFTDVWKATTEIFEAEFPGSQGDLSQQTVTSTPRYDHRDPKLRWQATARIVQLDLNWAVRVGVVAERLSGRKWKTIGPDDGTALWLLRRIDEKIQLSKGPPPEDPRFLPADPQREFAPAEDVDDPAKTNREDGSGGSGDDSPRP